MQAEPNLEESLPSAPFDYEWLFAASGEPVLIVDTATGCIVEANPSALRVLQATNAVVLGAPLSEIFAPDCAALLQTGLTQVLVEQRTCLLGLRAARGLLPLHVSVSMFRTASRAYFLVRLAANTPVQRQKERRAPKSAAYNALEGAPFGFVMTDAAFRIDYANPAFVAMLGRHSETELLGSALDGWLVLTDDDRSGLKHQISRRIARTRLVTLLHRRHRPPSRVAVDAICVPAGADSSWGFAVRESPAPH